MATKRVQVVQIDESCGVLEGRTVDFKEDIRITYRIGNPDASLAQGVLTVALPGINLESRWKVFEAIIPSESIVMDARRRQLELDITQEFEFADEEAALLIDQGR